MSRSPSNSAQTVPDDAWSIAAHRAEVLRPLLKLSTVNRCIVDEAAEELGVSPRRVYMLLHDLREGDGHVSALLARGRGLPEGTSLLSPGVEAVIQDAIRKKYLNRQRVPVNSVVADVARECRKHGLPVPSRSSVQRRIDQLNQMDIERARNGKNAARRLTSAGKSPAVRGPLRRVEIDHTPVDLILVDAIEREAIGRPYLTLAIDKYSRAILGAVVTFEAPSALSVGLCLTQVVTDKGPYIDELDQSVSWPMSGLPLGLYVDNGADFHSRALTRGCEEHGIALDYRPPGRPEYGGTVEKHIGTFMQMVHELPGTTWSNISDKGEYDSGGLAALTLREFEQWLLLAIAKYHGTFHKGVQTTPAAKWNEGVAEFGLTDVVTDARRFMLDFLPMERRSISREGFVWDYVFYFSNSLKPWIANRDKLGKFEIRRDPRDISRA